MIVAAILLGAVLVCVGGYVMHTVIPRATGGAMTFQHLAGYSVLVVGIALAVVFQAFAWWIFVGACVLAALVWGESF